MRSKRLLHSILSAILLLGLGPLLLFLSLWLALLTSLRSSKEHNTDAPPSAENHDSCPKSPRAQNQAFKNTVLSNPAAVKIHDYGPVDPKLVDAIRTASYEIASNLPVKVPVEIFIFQKTNFNTDVISKDICAALQLSEDSEQYKEIPAWLKRTAPRGQFAELQFTDKAGIVLFPIHEPEAAANRLWAMHEYFHIVQKDKYRNPQNHTLFHWYSEGTAEYISHYYNEQFGWGTLQEALDFHMKEIRREGPHRDLSEFEDSSDGPIYALGFWAVHYLLTVKQIKHEALFDTLFTDVATMGFQASFEKNAGLLLSQFYKEFKGYQRLHLLKHRFQTGR